MLIKIVKEVSNGMQISLGLVKCKTVTVDRRKLKNKLPIEIDNDTDIAINSDQLHKCLGIARKHKIEQGVVKEQLKQEFKDSLCQILRISINSRILIKMLLTPM